MFDRIAGRYDLVNRLMTMGVDRRWRRATIGACRITPSTDALDVCCGTGDLSFLLEKAGARSVVGVDFSVQMLERARERSAGSSSHVEFVEGDAMALPFGDDSFDVLTVGFGVRNVEKLDVAFAEFRRVLRSGGRLACLEITRPTSRASAAFHNVWFHKVVPVVGGIVSGDREAYSYLPESTRDFPQPRELADVIRAAGFPNPQWKTFGGGIVALHTATVPT
jgi:demethylmenaquinone methyltransferase/2-methoxy-6-polyprenyl-1,4-benzoquinol methylase